MIQKIMQQWMNKRTINSIARSNGISEEEVIKIINEYWNAL